MYLYEGNLFIAFVAGLLTTLSPCVLPVLPLIVGSSTNNDRLSPLFICFGLAFAFVVFGWTISVFGSFLGASAESLRIYSASLLGLFGLIFIIPQLSEMFSHALEPFTNRINKTISNLELGSRLSHLTIGFLLGAVWTPCSGPTLGTAITLASSEGANLKSLFIMIIFALGAVMPLFFVAYGAGSLLRQNRLKIFTVVLRAKKILGTLMIIIAGLVLTGTDKTLEAKVLSILPESWIDLTVKY